MTISTRTSISPQLSTAANAFASGRAKLAQFAAEDRQNAEDRANASEQFLQAQLVARRNAQAETCARNHEDAARCAALPARSEPRATCDLSHRSSQIACDENLRIVATLEQRLQTRVPLPAHPRACR